jgi:hypothetical protein
MSGIIDNWGAVQAVFAGLPHVLDLDAPGYRDPLGDELLDRAALAVYVQTAYRQLDPDGNALAPLAPSTLARKRRMGYPDTILVETSEMLAINQLAGTRTVTRDFAMSRYGVSPWERKKAEYAHQGSRNRPRRPFYAINDLARAMIDRHVDVVAGLNLNLL